MRYYYDGGLTFAEMRLWPFRRWVRFRVAYYTTPFPPVPYETHETFRTVLIAWGWRA